MYKMYIHEPDICHWWLQYQTQAGQYAIPTKRNKIFVPR